LARGADTGTDRNPRPARRQITGYGSIPFILDEDFNIAQGLIRMVGPGKIVHGDKMPLLPGNVTV
jgi:hypothetical protein